MTDDPIEADGKRHGPDEAGVADGHSTLGAVWQEGAPGHCVVKLRDLRASPPQAEAEITVGNAYGNNHSPSISDHKSGAGRVSAINVAWIESPAGDPSGAGRIMWQSFDASKLAEPANDNATWVSGPHGIGAIGYQPAIAGLEGGDTLVTWIGVDGNVHGHVYAPEDADAADAPHYASVNAALGDLGPAATGVDGGRRLQVAEPRPGTFAVMWLALADSGLALRGSLFLGPSDSGPAEDRLWIEQPISEIRLPPGSTGAFSLTGTGSESADLLVTYPVLDAATGAVRVLARHIDASEDGRGHSTPEVVVGAEASAEDSPGALPHAQVHHTTAVRPNGQDSGPPANAQMPANQDGGTHRALALTIAADPGVDERAPIVKAVDDGFVVVWQTPGASEGTVEIKLAIYDADGAPRILADGGTVVRVTDSAAAGVAPTISGLGSGVVVAYVGAGDGGLTVKAYDGAGDQIGKDTVVDSAEAGAISEVSLDAEAVKAEDGTVHDQVAVAYVRDSADTSAGNGDYGTIYLQRYEVAANDGQPRQLVELGLDGTHDGADGPAQITTETDGDPATSEAVYGRAPVVDALDDGGLAVAWVESLDAIETIKGRVLAPDGSQVLRLDLTDLIGAQGIARSTKPILLETSHGDILVNWLQPDGDDAGYVVMSARYEADRAGGWIMPDQPIRLQEFHDEPEEFSVTLSEGDATFLTVTWRTDSSGSGSGDGILSQRFDIDGQDLGRTTKIYDDSALDGGQQPVTDAFSAAGLADGKIVIVYTEQSRDGSVDLAAHVIEAPGVGQADSALAGGPASGASGPIPTADTFDFAPGYADAVVHREVMDMTYLGDTTYQQLVDSGALVEAGGDVAVALNLADPADPHNTTLKAVDLLVPADDYFKFS